MKPLHHWFRALSACVVVAAAWGCGAPSSPGAAALPAPLQRSARSWRSPETKSATALLYVANPFLGKIDIFSLHGLKYTLVGQITDPDGPDGMTTDGAGNLYVTDEGVATEGPAVGDIKVYPKGSTMYSRLIVPAKWVPFDAAVGRDGTMYVANIAPIGYFSPGSVSVYMPSASTPARVLRLRNFQVLGVALHRRSRTIYVSYDAIGSGGGKIAEFVHARGKATDLGVTYPEPWGIVEDGSDDLLVCDGAGVIEVYSESNGELVAQISVPNGASWLAFNQSRSRLYVSNFQQVEILSYPAGAVLGTIEQPGWSKTAYPTGVAFWPPPQ
jgi:sugar lactone lactonase YvrE